MDLGAFLLILAIHFVGAARCGRQPSHSFYLLVDIIKFVLVLRHDLHALHIGDGLAYPIDHPHPEKGVEECQNFLNYLFHVRLVRSF